MEVMKPSPVLAHKQEEVSVAPQVVGISDVAVPTGKLDDTAEQRADQPLFDTLGEPVRETIMRDVRSVAEKLLYVLRPRFRADKGAGLKHWDLWGPLFLCLSLGTVLAGQQRDSEQSGLVFALVFVIVWGGAGVVTLNAMMLRGQVSFFQSLCVLGYCMFPLVIAAVVSAIVGIRQVKAGLVAVCTVWSSMSSVSFMGELVPEDRKTLGMYPVWLFYVALGWIILIS